MSARGDAAETPEHGQLLRGIQHRLERFYGIEDCPNVVDFVRVAQGADAREALLVREQADAVELALVMPERLLGGAAAESDVDGYLQALEGVSHFVYLSEHVRTGLPTTRLELELQAEVDKFVLLALEAKGLDAPSRDAVCTTLYEDVRFLHAAMSEDGERYRFANHLAARYTRRLDPRAGPDVLKTKLRRFYRAGQTEKIRLARAA
jgi:hypothetical protein